MWLREGNMKKQLPDSWFVQFALALICCSFGVGFLHTGNFFYSGSLFLDSGEISYILLLYQSIFFGITGLIFLTLGICLSASVKVLTESLITGEKPDYSHISRMLLFIILLIILGSILVYIANYQIWTILQPYFHPSP
jgi:hypothetical protein